jgi:simple sugar transport system permease protein
MTMPRQLTSSVKIDSPVADTAPLPRHSLQRFFRHSSLGPAVTLVLVYILFFAVGHQHGFSTVAGTANWVDVSAELCIIAMPYSLLMIAGEFDLSIGSVIGASSMIVAICVVQYKIPVAVALVLALIFGAAIGWINGMLVVKAKLPSFIVTIGTNFVVAGATLGISRTLVNTAQMEVVIGGVFRSIFAAQWHQFNVSAIWAAGVSAIVIWVMASTRYGNWIYGIGGNLEAARRAGVRTDRIKIQLFMATGVAAGLVGIIETIEFNTGNGQAGQDFLFTTPVAVVVGGILLTGGYGEPLGVVMGAAIYGIVNGGIFYAGWDSDWAQAFLGFLMMLAVVSNNHVRRVALSEGRPADQRPFVAAIAERIWRRDKT